MQNFLNNDNTQAYKEIDLNAWHRGIEFYGFWAIEVTSENWCNNFDYAQSRLAPFLYDNYRRQPHIKISAAGLISEGEFSSTLLTGQIQALEGANLASFKLYLGYLNSFTTAPYISVIDNSDRLSVIRELLHTVCLEDCPTPYVPHLTLGLYDDQYSVSQVQNCLEEINIATGSELSVNAISFCRYHTHCLFSPFEIVKRIELKNNL